MWSVLSEVDISAEQARLGIWVAAAMGVLNAIANILNAWYSKRSKEKLELARIAAESAERIAKINAEAAQKAAEAARQSHAVLQAQVSDVQATVDSLANSGG